MIQTASDIRSLFVKLDALMNHPLTIYVIGGANLIAQGIIERATFDIDVVSPSKFSTEFIEYIEKIAQSDKLPRDWMNTMPSMDENFLAEGWKDRSILFFKGSQLSVHLLGRVDILGQKIAAAADRTKRDVDDILAMDPSPHEWDLAQAWARKYDSNPDWPHWIDQLVEQLKEKQSRG